MSLSLTKEKSKIFSGTSGIVTPVKKSLYPPEFMDKSRLTYYASLFTSLEVNSSFYKMPMASTVSKWSAAVGDNFQFTFKLSKSITHSKELDYREEDVNRFIETISFAGKKKGCLLIQFPPGLKISSISKLEQLLKRIEYADPLHSWKIAVEFRNYSWYHDDSFDLLERFRAAIVHHDLPASSTPLKDYKGSFRYLRFHGPGGRYRGSYEGSFLEEYAQYIKAWQAEGKTVYFYFNNTMGDAIKNLQTLNGLVGL